MGRYSYKAYSCEVGGCTPTIRKNSPKIIYWHVFPNPNDAYLKSLREKWISGIQKSRRDASWQPVQKSSRICSLHFEENRYYMHLGNPRLRCDAFPTLFDPPENRENCQKLSEDARNAIEPEETSVYTCIGCNKNVCVKISKNDRTKFLDLKMFLCEILNIGFQTEDEIESDSSALQHLPFCEKCISIVYDLRDVYIELSVLTHKFDTKRMKFIEKIVNSYLYTNYNKNVNVLPEGSVSNYEKTKADILKRWKTLLTDGTTQVEKPIVQNKYIEFSLDLEDAINETGDTTQLEEESLIIPSLSPSLVEECHLSLDADNFTKSDGIKSNQSCLIVFDDDIRWENEIEDWPVRMSDRDSCGLLDDEDRDCASAAAEDSDCASTAAEDSDCASTAAEDEMQINVRTKIAKHTYSRFKGSLPSKLHPTIEIGGEHRCFVCLTHVKTVEEISIHFNRRHCALICPVKVLSIREDKVGGCSKWCSSQHEMDLHTNVHMDNLFRCSHCEMTFYNDTVLQEHINMKHTLHRPYKCKLCPRRDGFFRECFLRRHAQKVHPGRPKEEIFQYEK